MYGGQGNYAPQFRQGPSGPSPPYQQAVPGPPSFLQPLPGSSLPPAPHGPAVHPLGQQASPYFGQAVAPLSQQPVHFPPPPPMNSSQYSQQLPPPPPPQLNVNAPIAPPYPLGGFSISVPMPNSNVHLGMQQPPPPRILRPTPQPNSQPQGPVLFHSSHPPHLRMLHAPPAPPWPINVSTPPPPARPPPFDLTIPASFTGKQHPARDVHPPSIPSTPPPPPPPPPPSSPPPLPPSPPTSISASEGFQIDSIEGFTTNSNIDSEARGFDDAPVYLADASRGLREGNMIRVVDGEILKNHSLPPLRPDDDVVRNMEVLCQFVAKVGPDFENIARAKEAGNPKFDFLFGGEPGSRAAIGYEYFQWMKKNYVTGREPSKGLKHNILSTSTLKANIFSQYGNMESMEVPQSPVTSDMDMEDDISPADKAFSNANKEHGVSANAYSYASDNVKEQLHDEIRLASGTSSPITSLLDAEEEKESSVFEDVSPDRCSPHTTNLSDGTHVSSRLPPRDSINGKVSPDNKDAKSQEALGLYLKYGSPFRLIQDYASDESDNENVRSGNQEDINHVSPRATTTGASILQEEKQPEPCSNFGVQDLSTVGDRSEYYTVTSYQLSPSRLQGAATSPDKSVPSTSNFDMLEKNVDPDNHKFENLLNDRIKTSGPFSVCDAIEERKMDIGLETEKLRVKESFSEQNASHDVDEFGRLVRKGASGSDSDRSPYGEKHPKRGRSWSKSLSRSPRENRRRRRSRSPRRRDDRSHSRSWSPKRRRSKSPQSFRSNMLSRRGRDLPPDCFNFIRGRCFYGASCRFLHRDSGHLNTHQRYQDSRKPRYLHSSDSLSSTRIGHYDKADVAELHSEKFNKLVEADDTINQTFFDKFSDGKTEPVPTHEAEDASNPLSRKMTPEAEDASNPVSWNTTPEVEDASNPMSRKITPEAEDTSNLVSPEVLPEAEDASNLVSPEVIPEAEYASNLVSPKLIPEVDDTGDLVSRELVPEAEDASNVVSQEIVRQVQESPVREVPFASVDGETTQHMSDSSEPLHAGSLSVRSSASKSVLSPQHNVFEQSASGDILSLETSQFNTIMSASEVEESIQHALPVQTSHSTTAIVQVSTSQVIVGENIAMEESANQDITTLTYSHDSTSMEPSVLPLHKEFSPHTLLISSGSNIPPPPPPQPHGQHTLPLPPPPLPGQPTLLLPPPPPMHGHHALPLPPPPPTHGQHPAFVPNDSSSCLFSQKFRENIAPPITSYQSQLSPEPYMFYPQRPPLPSNLHSSQPNLSFSGQHMLPLLSRPSFSPSEATNYQHNSAPQRNDFMPLVRPYPPGEVPVSRPSDFHSQAFISVPSVHPPLHLSFPTDQGDARVQNQGLMTPSSSMPLPRSFRGDWLDTRSYTREEFSTPHLRDIRQPLYNPPHPAGFGTTGTIHPSMQRYTENNFQPLQSDVGVPRFPIREHYNPYASAFEESRAGDPVIPGPQIRRYVPSLSADNDPIVGIGFGTRTSPRNSRRLSEQVARTGNYVHESSAQIILDAKKQLIQETVAGAPYDPLFDSIEGSPGASKIRVEEQNSGINDTGSASKRRVTKVGSKKNRGGLSTELKAEVDELGEVATDADAGGVENESPQLLDDKDWSPLVPFDVAETNVGEIEINQIRSPSKSKKNKDSRSMKLFKVAIADFAKEVLKPSWRQGNLSKEAFKTIVKKTVDKVAGAVPSYQIPKSQAKISQYVDSSQRKLTKLVMGYVDKYVKM